jgi:diketogulonate reductase-like aldo/keto reductase
MGADTWAKLFIKYGATNPASTCVTPSTSKAKHMLDNIGAAYGELPDVKIRRKWNS